jgi:hypothetical protein
LVQAASDGLDQKVKTLIQGGNDVNGTDFDGKTGSFFPLVFLQIHINGS